QVAGARPLRGPRQPRGRFPVSPVRGLAHSADRWRRVHPVSSARACSDVARSFAASRQAGRAGSVEIGDGRVRIAGMEVRAAPLVVSARVVRVRGDVSVPMSDDALEFTGFYELVIELLVSVEALRVRDSSGLESSHFSLPGADAGLALEGIDVAG